MIATAREAGALVVLDVKRGDIGSTAQAYADAYLDPRSPIAADAITAAPYLGFGSLDPMIATAREHGTGVFVLALTSNPEAPPFQHARTDGGRTVAGTVLAELADLNARRRADGLLRRRRRRHHRRHRRGPRHQRPAARARDRGAGRHRRRRTPDLRRRASTRCCPPARARSWLPDPTPGPCTRRSAARSTRSPRCGTALMGRTRLAGVVLAMALLARWPAAVGTASTTTAATSGPTARRWPRWSSRPRPIGPAEPPADAARPGREGTRGPHRRVAGLPRGAGRTSTRRSRTPG